MKKTNALRILDQHHIPYKTVAYEYDPARASVAEIARSCDLSPAQIFKTLVLKGNKTGVLVALVGGNRSLNMKSLASLSGNKKLALVPVKDLLEITGYVRGGCSPIGMKKRFPVFLDEAARALPRLYVNAGQRGLLFEIATADLIAVTGAIIAPIATIK